MEKPASSRLLNHFASVSDPRDPNIRHPFDIFVIALFAIISGAEGWEDPESGSGSMTSSMKSSPFPTCSGCWPWTGRR